MHYLRTEAWHKARMQALARKQRGFIINPYVYGVAGPTDPNFANVVLLLQLEGPDASTTITDTSNAPKSCSAVGSTALSTAQSRWGTSSCFNNYSTSNSHRITVAHDVALSLPGDFTIETSCWWVAAPTAGQSTPTFFSKKGAASGIEYWFLQLGNDLYFYYTTNGSTFQWVTVAFTPSTGQWYDIALSRVGSNAYFLVDGTQQGATQTLSGTIHSDLQAVEIFTDGTNNGTFNGYYGPLRVTKDVGRYNASGYTPAAFPNS